ncbi:hypothetical protein P389DRAFT_175346 [Cystobasidium minutum MCA 4210]|uniref:uncharacterized protein n=1 Tax=Cystobasidium minutum MCA 4210 TaxID=1397322 RepID=UPI0034CFE3F4|eukprot:jgi/Rhomi1/175346/fgenesh1_kg.10_\
MSALTSSNPDNANPTVHKTGNESSSRSRYRLGDFLDEEDGDDYYYYSTGQEEGSSSSSSTALNKDVSMHEDGLTFEGQTESEHSSDEEGEPIDSQEIFDLIRSTTDPEHPLTLEQLAVVSVEQCKVTNGPRPSVFVEFTPTVGHCSMATLIGLCLRVRLMRSLPDRYKIDIRVKPGSHESENSLNKQLNDKERVAAAMENNHLLEVVHECLRNAGERGGQHKH